VDIVQDGPVIATHPRGYGPHPQVLDPRHYLDTLQRRPAALDHANVFRHGQLPAVFDELRRDLGRQHGSRRGVKHYVRVLHLLLDHPLDTVQQAVETSRGAAGLDVEALLLRVRRQQATAATTPLDLSDRAEAVRDVRVPLPDVQKFNQLLSSKEIKHDRSEPPATQEQSQTTPPAGDECRVRGPGPRGSGGQRELARAANMLKARIKQANFPAAKDFDSYDFMAQPSLNKAQILARARGGWIDEHSNICLIGHSGTGKTPLALALGLAACRQGRRVRFFTAAGLVNRLEEAQKPYQLDRLLEQVQRAELLICDELGSLSFNRTGAELLFQVFAERYERRSLLVTSNLPFGAWVQVFQGERMRAALLDRLTHRCPILEMNGESYRFRESMKAKKAAKASK
jgi:DNA replication protein DnaC